MKIINILTEAIQLDKLITPDIKKIGQLFKGSGHEIRIVGGAVRDAVVGKEPKDIDLATTATPEEMVSIAQKHDIKYIETGLQHGTITMVINGEPYEITTLRIDKETDGRHAQVEWTRSFKEDAARRDLTFNAMSVDMNGNLHDYFGGVQDLKTGRAKFVGDTGQRIEEDYLRILRYFRFLGRQSNPARDEKDLAKIRETSKGLEQISGERIWAELAKIITGENVANILSQMKDANVLQKIGIDRFDFASAERTASFDAKPVTVLCHLLKNEYSFMEILKRYKLSNEEKKLGIFVLANSDSNLSKQWKKMLVLEKQSPEHLSELALYLHDAPLAQQILSYDIPTFTVTGDDLIRQGFKPGPELGKELRKRKEEWFNQL